MIQSNIDTGIGDAEFKLLIDQDHMEKVWSIMEPEVRKYADGYLEGVSHFKDLPSAQDSYTAFLQEMIKKNDALHDKYHELFALDLMEEEYAEDTEGFKSAILKKECDVIRKTLQSKSESLKEWKSKFYGCKSQVLYDTLFNMMEFASEFDEEMDEDAMNELDEIAECRLDEMEEDSCYKSGVLGFGIVSNILNHMYPRTFPGNYKAGIYSLYFLSGGGKGIDMQSETSEFCMVKDESRSKTGIIEMEHNFFYPYQTFCIYTLRIYRVLAGAISSCFDRVFPSEYRFLLTNDFYDYVTSKNREKIATMTGNDDMLKFSTIW